MLGLALAGACASPLVTPAEAALPDAVERTRPLTLGPVISIVSPDVVANQPITATRAVRSPFDLNVKFAERGGEKVNPSSIRLVYLKVPEIDLTDRIQGRVSEGGLVFSALELPPGTHTFRLSVLDRKSRSSTKLFQVTVN